MNKLIPYVLLLVMIGMLFLSWKNVSNYYGSINASYNACMERAAAYEEKKIYVDAVKEYEAALRIKSDDYETAMKIVDLYALLDNGKSYAAACENAIKADPSQVKPYVDLADHYLYDENNAKALEVLMRAKEYVENDADILERIQRIKGQYILVIPKFAVTSPYYYVGNTAYTLIGDETCMGLQGSSIIVSPEDGYESVGLPASDVIPVKKDGEWYYIDEDGYRKLVPDTPAEYLGSFTAGYAPARINGVYGYLDKEMQEYHFEFQFAGHFSNGLAAVQKDGKWAVINTSFKEVTDYIFDEILLDAYGFCSTYGVFFAKQDGKYYLYNKDGEKISDGYEDAKLFASNEPAAVKLNGKWGFISNSGEMVIEPAYEDADSFSIGYAPFFENGKWGCIDEDGVVLIEPTFDAMKPFAKNGYALVDVDGMQKFAVVDIYE